jgi:anti-sigma-K factor RskA
MTCQQLTEFYELYALGLLEEGEGRSELSGHIARQCPNCTAGVRANLEAMAGLALLATTEEPPRNLRDRILRAAEEAPEKSSQKSKVIAMPAAGQTAARRPTPWLWMALAAALLLALGASLFQQNQLSDELRAARGEVRRLADRAAVDGKELASLRRALNVLDGAGTRLVDFGGGPRGRVFVNPQNGVLLLASNLPRLESGKTFQMWVVPKTGNPASAGLFQADAAGKAVHLFDNAVDLAATAAVAISVEPEGGSAAPTTTPIVIAPVAGI